MTSSARCGADLTDDQRPSTQCGTPTQHVTTDAPSSTAFIGRRRPNTWKWLLGITVIIVVGLAVVGHRAYGRVAVPGASVAAARPSPGTAQVPVEVLYVADGVDDSVLMYAVGDRGALTLIGSIQGPATQLSGPAGLAVDAAGKLYVANAGANAVTEYAKGSKGNVAPLAVIRGLATKLNLPQGIAVTDSGTLYVANHGSYGPTTGPGVTNVIPGAVTVYAPGSRGGVAPVGMIAGRTSAGLVGPYDVAVDRANSLYVASSGLSAADNVVRVYSQWSLAPVATIAGPATGLNRATALAVDTTDTLYVANAGGSLSDNAVTVYGPATVGNVTPSAVIRGSQTGLYRPSGIALDARGTIFVAGAAFVGASREYTIAEYEPGASGNVAPAAVLHIPVTRMKRSGSLGMGPTGVAVYSPEGLFGPATVWQQVPFQAIGQACPNPRDVRCIVNTMARLGGSPSAVDFFRVTRAFLTGYQAVGRVSFGQTLQPWAANDNVGLVMLNGAPPVVWVGSGLQPGDLERAPLYQQVRRQFPYLGLSANTPRFEQVHPYGAGGQEFVFEVPLVNGCHACITDYRARAAYDFAADGTYVGLPRVLDLCARAPLGRGTAGALTAPCPDK